MARRCGWLLVLLLCAGGGCRKKTAPPAPVPAAPPADAGDVATTAKPPAPAPDASADASADGGTLAVANGNLIVAGPDGVKELGPGGAVVRVISRTGGRHPRFLSRDEIVMLTLRDQSSGEVKELQRVSLVTGESRMIARLPRLGCRGWDQLALQSAEDFGVTEDGRYACLQLMDRNVNMADVGVSVRIDLRNGKVGMHQDLGKEECPISRAKGPELECTARQPERGSSDGTGLKQIPGLPVFEEDGLEAYSLSGSWMLLHGELEDADYIHRPLVLLDRRDGKAYPLRPGPWPKPLTRRELERIAKAASSEDQDKAGTLIAVGETELRWVRLGGQDALIADGTLHIPRSPSIVLPGDVAY